MKSLCGPERAKLLRLRGWRLALVFATWSCAVLAGFGVLTVYSGTPGIERAVAADWPAASTLDRHDRATLVMFLHPQCPCSMASLEQLNRIMAGARAPISTWVVFVRPNDMPEGWERGALWSEAGRIPGVQSYVDVDGVEARRFGAATSGAAMFFGTSGELLFAGGITGLRGHAGDNPSAGAIAAALADESLPLVRTPVFGCSLFDRVGLEER